jgi:uncharacterized protein
MTYIVDTLVNMPVKAEDRLVERAPDVLRWFNQRADVITGGSTVEDLIAEMDEAQVDHAMIIARNGWHHPKTRPQGPLATSHGVDDDIFDMFCEEAAAAVARYPDRLSATVMLDPMGAMRAMRQLERAVKEYKFIAARLMPAATGVPANHPLCYPLYSKCIELGVPMMVNMGLPGPRRSGRVQQPVLLEDVLLAYPDLTLVGSHIGHPWHLETVALLQKFSNFYLTTAGWAPRYVPAEIIHLMNTRGPDRVMWGTDYPLMGIKRAADEAFALPLKADRCEGYLGANAKKIFGF